jgi:hypothetical protein
MLTSTMWRRLCQALYLETTLLGASSTRYISAGHASLLVNFFLLTFVRASIVSLDWPFDNLGFLSEKLGQMILHVIRS